MWETNINRGEMLMAVGKPTVIKVRGIQTVPGISSIEKSRTRTSPFQIHLQENKLIRNGLKEI